MNTPDLTSTTDLALSEALVTRLCNEYSVTPDGCTTVALFPYTKFKTLPDMDDVCESLRLVLPDGKSWLEALPTRPNVMPIIRGTHAVFLRTIRGAMGPIVPVPVGTLFVRLYISTALPAQVGFELIAVQVSPGNKEGRAMDIVRAYHFPDSTVSGIRYTFTPLKQEPCWISFNDIDDLARRLGPGVDNETGYSA